MVGTHSTPSHLQATQPQRDNVITAVWINGSALWELHDPNLKNGPCCKTYCTSKEREYMVDMRGCQWLTGLKIRKGNHIRVARNPPGLDHFRKANGSALCLNWSPAVRGKQKYPMIVTQCCVNSFQHIIDSVAVLKLEGWTGMIVTRLSHIQIRLAELVTDMLFPYCRKPSLLSDQKNRPCSFSFCWFSNTIARINVGSVPLCKAQIVQFGNVWSENAGLMVWLWLWLAWNGWFGRYKHDSKMYRNSTTIPSTSGY